MIPFATVVLTDMLGAVLYFYFTLMIVCVCVYVCVRVQIFLIYLWPSYTLLDLGHSVAL